MNQIPGYYVELPLSDYREIWDLQQSIVKIKNEKKLAADVILALEHRPVFTLGRRGGFENLAVSREFIEKSGIQLVQVERGGNITYHGPGQLVVYPILDLNMARLGISDLVGLLEDIMLRSAAEFGITAERNAKNRGVWVGNSKLGSIGIAVRKGISFHGFALNVDLQLEPFEWINPCGLTDIGMTSMEKELSKKVPMAEIRKTVKRQTESVLDREFSPATIDQIMKSRSFSDHL
jgi:lipoate-protein ligase B